MNNLEKLQVKNEKSFYVLIYIIYALSLILTAFVAIKNDSIIFLALFSIDVLIVPYIIRYVYKTWGKHVEYEKEYSRLILKEILNKFKDIKQYNFCNGIDKTKYKEADFDKYDDIYISKNYVQGLIDEKYYFEMANVYTRNRRLFTMDYVFIFDGTFVILDIPKKAEERIFITKQNKLGLGRPDILSNNYKIYCKNKSNNKEQFNIKLIEKILEINVFDEIVIKDNKMYLRSYRNVFELPNVKEESLTKDRIVNDYNSYENILNSLNKIVKEI